MENEQKDKFEKFANSTESEAAIETFKLLLNSLNLQNPTYPEIRAAILPSLPYKYKSLFTTLDKKYDKSASLRSIRREILISGGGPCGLRAAVEAAILGHSVKVVELRNECTRHNILKTWQNTIDDLVTLGVMTFGIVKVHGHLHMGTREIQLCLIKTGLVLGVEIIQGRGVCGLIDPVVGLGNVKDAGKWSVWTLPTSLARELQGRKDLAQELALKPGETDVSRLEQTSKVDFMEYAESQDGAIHRKKWDLPPEAIVYFFDAIIVAEGESSRLIRKLGFDRKIAKFNEAIGIVVNLDWSPLACKHDSKEKKIEEFVVWRSSADWRESCLGRLSDLGINLENMEYMRGTNTHFIAATTKAKVLLEYGIFKESKGKVRDTLVASNMNFDMLRKFGRQLATVAGIPEEAEFASKNGVQAFDFSCRGLCVESFKYFKSAEPEVYQDLLVLPAGDSLQNPYWPQGLGVNRGFHNCLDAAWAAHLQVTGVERATVEEERTFSFKLADWKTFSTHSLTSGNSWTADPATRYSLELVKSMHFQDIENKTANSSIPVRYRKLANIK